MKNISLNENVNKSHLYQIENSLNPVVAAASPIISLLTRVYGIDPNTPEPETWQAICQHELNICLDKCAVKGYDHEQILLIKAIIINWINYTSIWQYQTNNACEHDGLYKILMQDSSKNFHIIELLYILNRLGLPLADNPQINELNIQELYYLIQDTRQSTTNALQKQQNMKMWLHANKNHRNSNKQWLAFLSFGFCLCLFGIWQLWLSANIQMQTYFVNSQVF